MAGGRIYVDQVTIGDVDLFKVIANPDGVLTARKGSMAFLNAGSVTASVFINLDGATAWRNLTAASGPLVHTLTPVATTLLAPDSGPGADAFPTPAVIREDGDYWVHLSAVYSISTALAAGTTLRSFLVETSINGVRTGTIIPAPAGNLDGFMLWGWLAGLSGAYNANLLVRLNGLSAGDAISVIFGHVAALVPPPTISMSIRSLGILKVQ